MKEVRRQDRESVQTKTERGKSSFLLDELTEKKGEPIEWSGHENDRMENGCRGRAAVSEEYTTSTSRLSTRNRNHFPLDAATPNVFDAEWQHSLQMFSPWPRAHIHPIPDAAILNDAISSKKNCIRFLLSVLLLKILNAFESRIRWTNVSNTPESIA